jgi:hypothetical protein
MTARRQSRRGPATSRSEPRAAAFYCMSSAAYFLGAVSLINSLRLIGHLEPIFVLDCGLTPAQRELLEPHVSLVRAPRDAEPFMLKTVAPVEHPAEVTILIDVDMVVTRPLTELIREASENRVLAIEHGQDRSVPQWGELLDLGPVRRQPYLSSGLVFLGGPFGREVIRLMDELMDRIEFDRSIFRTTFPRYPYVEDGQAPPADPEYPFFLVDQDLLNAILATRGERRQVVPLDRRLEAIPPFRGLRVVDEQALECAYEDGVRPYVVHHYGAKPWLKSTPYGIYTHLLRRLLLSDDVAVRVPRRQLPGQLRSGPVAAARRWYSTAAVSSRIRALRHRATGSDS